MAKKGSWTDPQGTTEPAQGPFTKLAGLRDTLLPSDPALRDTIPELPAVNPASSVVTSRPLVRPGIGAGPAKAVIRLERAGRGGKDVTIVDKLGLGASELGMWLRDLKAQLGCGGAVEGDALVFQGDLRKRIAPMLEARGVRKVIQG